jgi:hypothetical protein
MKRNCFLVIAQKLSYASRTCIDADQSPPFFEAALAAPDKLGDSFGSSSVPG